MATAGTCTARASASPSAASAAPPLTSRAEPSLRLSRSPTSRADAIEPVKTVTAIRPCPARRSSCSQVHPAPVGRGAFGHESESASAPAAPAARSAVGACRLPRLSVGSIVNRRITPPIRARSCDCEFGPERESPRRDLGARQRAAEGTDAPEHGDGTCSGPGAGVLYRMRSASSTRPCALADAERSASSA